MFGDICICTIHDLKYGERGQESNAISDEKRKEMERRFPGKKDGQSVRDAFSGRGYMFMG